MENKTILEWFEEAKQNGAEWADEAISETRRLRGEERLTVEKVSLREALLGAFSWCQSWQGEDYWSDIKKSLPRQKIDY